MFIVLGWVNVFCLSLQIFICALGPQLTLFNSILEVKLRQFITMQIKVTKCSKDKSRKCGSYHALGNIKKTMKLLTLVVIVL